MDDTYQKQIFKSPWSDIKEHSLRDGLILVSKDLALEVAARAVVENNTETVNSWIESNLVGKPTKDQLEAWNNEESKAFLLFIAQPYVLIQELELQ